ncbi:hypothetical protein M422DRAFT_775550 [Sphaerobolus stellatus SS14]|nr:hypothetical protein M422DRAFT_775550 [Sphaerobolus stellatus SS14]
MDSNVTVNAPAALLHGFSLDNTLGALLIGLVVSTALFGLTSMQVWIYFNTYFNDPRFLKLVVGVLWILDLTHTVLITHAAYHFFINNFGNVAGLAKGEWSIIIEVAVTTMMTLLVQCFFAFRLYRLSHGNWVLVGCIFVLAMGHVALGTLSVVRLFQIRLFSRVPEISDILSATLIVMAVNDALITLSLCYYLQKAQKKSKKHDAVRLLTIYTIETGGLISVVVIINAVFALVMPSNWIFIGIEFVLAKLYSNSLLTILNSRASIRSKFGDMFSNSRTPGGSQQPISMGIVHNQTDPGSIQIHLNTIKTVEISPPDPYDHYSHSSYPHAI